MPAPDAECYPLGIAELPCLFPAALGQLRPANGKVYGVPRSCCLGRLKTVTVALDTPRSAGVAGGNLKLISPLGSGRVRAMVQAGLGLSAPMTLLSVPSSTCLSHLSIRCGERRPRLRPRRALVQQSHISFIAML